MDVKLFLMTMDNLEVLIKIFRFLKFKCSLKDGEATQTQAIV
jgi:hypothetical protein